MRSAPALSRFEPYEVTMVTSTFVIGVAGALLLNRVPPAAERVIPTWGLYVFFVALALTSAAVLLGIAMGTARGLQLQRSGSIALAGLCFAFTAWTFSAAGLTAYRSVIFLTMITTAALWQSRRIHRALRPRKDPQ